MQERAHLALSDPALTEPGRAETIVVPVASAHQETSQDGGAMINLHQPSDGRAVPFAERAPLDANATSEPRGEHDGH
jgi:hypothetical protein